MNNDYFKIINELRSKKADNFFAKTKSDLELRVEAKEVVRDLSWIEMLEETIPYIDNIVRNPRKFIVQEEELIPVEKTKKVTEESIKHLAKHTSLIQDVDKNGDIKPLKLLNTFKEETMELYENRFIYSLIVNTKTFLNNYLETNNITEKSKVTKVLNYRGESELPLEKVKYKLIITSESLDNSEEKSKNVSVDDRIRRIIEIFDDFLSTQFIKTLTGAAPVRSPIRKTNVILKDKNFIKAVDLWEFIEKYNTEEATKIEETSTKVEIPNLNDKIKIGSYLQYLAIEKENQEEESYKFSEANISKLIQDYVAENYGSEKQFKLFLTREFKLAKDKKEKDYNEIINIYHKSIEKHNERMKSALLFLK